MTDNTRHVLQKPIAGELPSHFKLFSMSRVDICCIKILDAFMTDTVLQKPSAGELPTLVGPVAAHMQAATALTEGRRSAVFNHQKTVADSLQALSWMVYTGPGCGEHTVYAALRQFLTMSIIPELCSTIEIDKTHASQG